MSALSYDAALFAAADRHWSSGNGATATIAFTIWRDEGEELLTDYLVEVCVEDGRVSWAQADRRNGIAYAKPIDWELTDAETTEAVERAAEAEVEARWDA